MPMNATRAHSGLDAVRRHPWRSAGVAVVVAVALLVLLWDWNWMRKPLCRYVQAQTKRSCEIAGNLDVDPGRVTRVTADSVRFGNAAWSKRGDMARADRIVVDVELWPALFRHQFRVPELRLVHPVVQLETGPDGRGNWVIGDGGSGMQAQFRRLRIDDGRLRFNDDANETDLDFAVASEAAKGPGAAAPIRVDGKGHWKGSPFTLQGRGESPLALGDSERPYRVDLTASAGNTHAHAVGTLLDPLRFRDFDLRLALRGQDLADLYPLLGIAAPPTPPYRLEGRLTRELDGAGGSTFGIVCYAPNSAGRFDDAQRGAMGNEVHDDGMHKTDSVDYDVVISGKIDVYLDGGEMRTLSQGSMIVMAGANHSWQNPYDEPCVFATVNLGATS